MIHVTWDFVPVWTSCSQLHIPEPYLWEGPLTGHAFLLVLGFTSIKLISDISGDSASFIYDYKNQPKAAFDFLSWLWNCNQWQYSQDFAQCTDYFFFKIMSSLSPLNALMKAKMISISEKSACRGLKFHKTPPQRKGTSWKYVLCVICFLIRADPAKYSTLELEQHNSPPLDSML